MGFAVLHRSCGLSTKAFVIAGDAETEEGMTYETRNVASALGMKNLIVTLDYNEQGIDGPIIEAMPSPYLNHWFAPGWNIIEVDGHNVLELAYAYRLVDQGFGAQRPTVVICHCIKGKHYGKLEGSADSHGTPLPHPEYVEAMKKLGFDIPGKEGDAAADIEVVMQALGAAENDYLVERLQAAAARLTPEPELKARIEVALPGRPMADYTSLERPAELPPELLFPEGGAVATRKATEAWFEWAMKHTAFFYVGSGDLMKSILTGKAENVYGVLSRENRLGRGLRFGIAEQNMAMMSTAMAQDTLPGGFRPMSAFATYGVFTPMMANCGSHDADQQRRESVHQGLLHHAGGARRAGDRRGRSDPPRALLDVAVHRVPRHQGLQAAGRQRDRRDAVPRGAEGRAGGVLRGAAAHAGAEARQRHSAGQRGDQGRLRLPAVPRQRQAQAGAGGVRRAGDGESARGPSRDRGDGRRQDRGRHVAAALRGVEADAIRSRRTRFSPTRSGSMS